MSEPMRVVQCWDDGVTADIKVVDILRRYGAKATFNLNFGFHDDERSRRREHQGTIVEKMGLREMREVYEGFTIANHGLRHVSLAECSREDGLRDVVDGRRALQDFFQAPILGFAYANGSYNEQAMDILREAGHVYGRTCVNVEQCFPPEDPMAFHSNCHFRDGSFWAKYEKSRKCGVFYFWGHSYEMVTDEMWADYEEKIARISADPDSVWDVVENLQG